MLYNLKITDFSLAQIRFQPSRYFVINTGLHDITDVMLVQTDVYEVLMTSPVVTSTFARDVCIDDV